MLKYLKYILRLIAYWLIVFFVFRLLFVVLNLKAIEPTNDGLYQALFKGLALDISTISYFISLPFLCLFGKALFTSSFFEKICLWFNRFLLLAVLLISVSNILLYADWGTLLNQRAINLLKTPKGLTNSLSVGQMLSFAVVLIVFYWVLEKMRSLVVDNFFPKNPLPKLKAILSFPLFIALLILGIRGGLGVMPINESAVYYSPHMFNNHVAVNPSWHFIHTIIERRVEENPFVFMENEEAEVIVENLLEHKAIVADSLLNSLLYNVVIIGLESMSTQFLESYGGYAGLTPNLDKLVKNNKATTFRKAYGSGYRTDQGFASLISGYPALPDQSVILLEDKIQGLPSLAKTFEANGYGTSFFYGGELTFANMGVYISQMGFNKIVSQKDFPKEYHTQRWGVDDKAFLNEVANQISVQKEPFFTFVMTVGQHAPYDVPGYDASLSDEERFKFAAHYADAGIGEFLGKMKAWSGYDRTIFVFVADHGHPGPKHYGNHTDKSRHLPLIFLSPNRIPQLDSLKNTICSHHALPNILIDALGMENEEKFPWAGIPNKHPFAYYSNEDGLGWITENGYGFYNYTKKTWHFPNETPLNPLEQKQAKAYLQVLYNDFLGLENK